MNVTFLKLNDSIWVRPGHSSGSGNGALLFEEGGFRDVSATALAHTKGFRPTCDGDWFNKQVDHLPGKPTKPGAYWLRFSYRWVLAEVFNYNATLWYQTINNPHGASVRQCQNLDGFIPLPAAPE